MAMTWKYFKEHNDSNFLLYDRNGELLRTGWEYAPNFDPEIIDVIEDIDMNHKRVILDFVPPNSEEDIEEEKEQPLYESFRKASKDLKMAMEILQSDGFSREEAFELIKRGAFIWFANFTTLSGGYCV